jgi:predicted glycoside hydrolase/deacetylase ChbG (UPF0249 family)
LGVHLTLTSEWDRYRWGPVSTRSCDSGLIDDRGYFHRSTAEFREHADRDAVRREMAAQLDRAERLGLAPTHVDCHMLAVLHEPFIEDYLQLGLGREMPAFLPRRHARTTNVENWLPDWENEWRQCGMPVFDGYEVVTQRPHVNDQTAFVRAVFKRLPCGLSCVLLHPAIGTDELRFVTDEWRGRVADYEAFRDPSLRDYVQELGIQLISYQPLRAVLAQRLREAAVHGAAVVSRANSPQES